MIELPQENIYAHTKKLKFLIKNIDEFIKTKNRKINILDFGCGNGAAISQYLIRDEVNLYGVDIHDESIEFANKNFGKANAVFLKEIPKGILFDIIVYADVLEHLESPAKFLIQHYELLKEDGIILGSIPNGYGPFEIEKKITTILGLEALVQYLIRLKRKIKNSSAEQIPYNFESGHVNFFTLKKFKKLLENCGFKLTNLDKGGFIGAPFSDRILGKFNFFIHYNIKLGEILPYWLVSTWYFKAVKITSVQNN